MVHATSHESQGTFLLNKMRFLIVSLWNTCFALSVFYLLLNALAKTSYQLVLVICFLLANLQSHFMQRNLVWKSRGPYFHELFRFYVSAILISSMNLILLAYFVEILNFPVYESQVFLALTLAIANYFFQKYLVFRLHKK